MTQMDTQTKMIDGTKFTMSMMDPFASNRLFIDVMKVVAPTVAAVADGFAKGEEAPELGSILDKDVDFGVLGRAAGKFFQVLDSSLVERMAHEFGQLTEMETDGHSMLLESAVQPAVFRGKIDLMYKWIFWGAQVQWGKLFGALVSGVSGQGALTQTPKGKKRKG